MREVDDSALIMKPEEQEKTADGLYAGHEGEGGGMDEFEIFFIE